MPGTFVGSGVMFIENVGQFDPRARFQVRGGIGTMYLAEDAILLTVLEPEKKAEREPDRLGHHEADVSTTDEPRRGVNLRLSFPGANPRPVIEPSNRLETKVSYFFGNDPEQWHPDVPVWGGVRYKALYPGVDLEIAEENGRWDWRLVGHGPESAAGVKELRLLIEGADKLSPDLGGLRLSTAAGSLRLPLPRLEGGFGSDWSIETPQGLQLDVKAFDPASLQHDQPNPHSATSETSPYSTFLGGSGVDEGWGIAVDAAGAAYVTGKTPSTDFPATPGSAGSGLGGDAFVIKLNAAGSALSYATFLGGSGADEGRGIAIDSSGNALVTGNSKSSNFPTAGAAWDTTYNGGSGGDAFVVKLNAAGSSLIYSTYLGGSGTDAGNRLAVDGSGAAYVTGYTYSSNFPVTPGAFDTTNNGGGDAFVAKLNAAGSSGAYATFLGGSYSDSGVGIAVDSSGSAYVAGTTRSSNFPTTSGAFDKTFNGGYSDAFVVKLTADGSARVYSTYLGGSTLNGTDGRDDGNAIVVAGDGTAYVTGYTASADFPITAGALDRTNVEGDAFVVKVNAGGSALVYGTLVGGSGFDDGLGIAIAGGAAYVTGLTGSADFPTTSGAVDGTYNGGSDGFLVKVDTTGSDLTYATVLGGSGFDTGYDIAISGDGAAYVTGYTYSTDFPTTAGAFDRTHNGGYDAFAVKAGLATTYRISGRVTDATGAGIAGVIVTASSAVSATTLATGRYTITAPAGTYSLAPAKTGYGFTPARRSRVTLPPDAVGQDFAAITCSSATASPPVLLIHGWGGGDRMRDDTMGFAQLSQWMDGYVEGCNLFFATGITSLQKEDDNRRAISENLRAAFDKVLALNPSWRGHFDVIGHSYGGLWARLYLESPFYAQDTRYRGHGIHVDNLFTLGTPHGGTILPYEAYLGDFLIAGTHGKNGYDILSAARLLAEVRDWYNRSHRQPNDVCYRLIGGDFLRQREVPLALRLLYLPLPRGDIGVSLRSSLDLAVNPSLGRRYPRAVATATTDMHGYFPPLGNLQSYVSPSLTYGASIAPFLGASPAQCQFGPSSPADAAVASEHEEAGQPMLLQTGAITERAVITGSATVDWTGPTAFYASWSAGDIDLTLANPAGSLVTSTVALEDPNSDYNKLVLGTAGLLSFVFTDTLTGPWTYTLTAPSGPFPIDFDLYVVPSSPLVLRAFAQPWQPAGASPVITASLAYSRTPVTTATVEATVERPDGSQSAIVLHDDGAYPDAQAADGVYSGSFTDAAVGGLYQVQVSAAGEFDGGAYRRSARAVFFVSAGTARLTGSYADSAVDDDGDGLYEYLDVDVGISAVEQTDLILAAVLEGADGRYIDLANTAVVSATGPMTVSLRFSGNRIRLEGFDGPLTVTQVLLLDDAAAIKADEVQVAWRTAAYNHRAFDSEDIPPSSVTVVGPTTGPAPATHVFTASVQPLTATMPISYTWQVDGLEVAVDLGALTSTITLSLTNAGAHAIIATATNSSGSVSTTHTITVGAPVHAAFSANPLTGFPPVAVVFTNESTGDFSSALWDFGDGITSTTSAISLTHTYYAPGTYTVTLTVSGLGGTDGAVRPGYVVATAWRYHSSLTEILREAPASVHSDLEAALRRLLELLAEPVRHLLRL